MHGKQKNPDKVEVLLVAGVGFEPTTSGLWARRASRLLHPAIRCVVNMIHYHLLFVNKVHESIF